MTSVIDVKYNVIPVQFEGCLIFCSESFQWSFSAENKVCLNDRCTLNLIGKDNLHWWCGSFDQL